MIDNYRRAAAYATRVVEHLDHSQLDEPSNNDGWTVRVLAEHLIGGNHMFAAGLGGQDVSSGLPYTIKDGDDLATAHRESVDRLVEAFAVEGALDATVKLPVGPTPGAVVAFIAFQEQLLHGWDLARSIGADPVFDEDLAAVVDAGLRPNMTDYSSAGLYQPELPVAEDASNYEKVLTLTGREP